jgi:hypothetical protein
MSVLLADKALLERMVRAVENVRRRMERAARALAEAGVPYAVAGGNAVAAWVATVDEAAIRNTQDVDIVLRRGDLPAARAALESVGFIFRHVKSIDMFLDGPAAKARDAVHVLFAGEKVRAEDVQPVPDVEQVFNPLSVIPPNRSTLSTIADRSTCELSVRIRRSVIRTCDGVTRKSPEICLTCRGDLSTENPNRVMPAR